MAQKVEKIRQVSTKKQLCFAKLSSLLQYLVRQKIYNDKRYAVLTYHNLFEESVDDLRIRLRRSAYVGISEFEKQMKYIKDNCTVIPLEKMVERIFKREPPDRFYVAVTFDDGYEDNFTLALPILKKYSIHATFFISTGFVDDRFFRPWWDDIVFFTATYKDSFCLSLGDSTKRTFLLRCETDMKNFLLLVEKFIKRNYPYSVNEVLGQLYSLNGGKKRLKNRFMDWNMIKESVQDGLISIGGHTVTHPILTKCEDFGREEIGKGKETIEAVLGQPVELFAYPFGGRETFNGEVIKVVQELGFKAAFTLLTGYNDTRTDLYKLRRVRIAGYDDLNNFKTRLHYARLVSVLENKNWRLFK